MATAYEVELLFRGGNTAALDKLERRLSDLERKLAGGVGGSDPFKPLGDSAGRAQLRIGALIGTVGRLAAAYGAIRAAQGIFGATSEIETQTRSIQVLTGSLTKAKDIVAQLQQYGAVTPFTSSELIDTAKRLKSFGVDSEKVVDTVKRLGDVAGATGADLQGISLAYGQVIAKGRLQGEELLQFQERGIALGEALRKEYKLTGPEFQKALEGGRISAEAVTVALERLTSKGGQYFNGAIAQSDTLSGKLSTLQDGIQRLAAAFGEILAPAMKTALDLANQGLESMIARVRELNTGSTARKDRFEQASKQAEYETINKYGRFTLGNEAPNFFNKRREEIFKQKMAELALPEQKTPTTPTPLPPLSTGNQDARLREAQEATIKRLQDLETDSIEKIRDLNLDVIKQVEEARARAIERGADLQKGLITEERNLRRQIEDAEARAQLQRDIGALGGDPAQVEAQKRLLEFEASYKQKQRDLDRAAQDSQQERALRLETFKRDTAKDIGEINRRYLENYGKIQQDYATNSAKILVTGAENMARIIEAAATNAANTLSGGGTAATAGGGGGDFASRYFRRLASLESDLSSGAKNRKSGARGYFQFLPSTLEDVERRGITTKAAALSSNFDEAAKAAMDYAIAMRPITKYLLEQGDVKGLDRVLNRLWTSLPGGAEAASGDRLARANAFLAGGAPGGARGAAMPTTGTWETGAGYTITGFRDQQGRPVVMTKEAAESFARMVADSGGKVRAADIASSQRSREKNRAVGGAEGSLHMSGLAMDIHGGSQQWIRQYGAKYGWQFNDYPGSHGGHAEFMGPAGAPGAAAPAYMTARLAPLPKPLGPQAGPDISDIVRRATNQMAGLQGLGARLAEAEKAGTREQFRNSEAEAIARVNSNLTEQVRLGELDNAQYQQRLAYLEEGINPALADSFAELDRQVGLNRELLDYQIALYRGRLADTSLTKEMVPIYEDLLRLAEGQRDALPSITAQRRDQMVAADQMRKSPRARLAEEMAGRSEKLGELLDPANQLISAADTIGDAFGNAFQDIVSGSKSAKEALSDMFKDIGSSFLKMASQILAQQAAMGILRLFGGALGGGGGGGGLLAGSGILNGNIFGGGFSIPNVSYFAEGGYAAGPTAAVVGEGGESEYIIPSSKMGSAMARYSAGARGDAVLEGPDGIASGGDGSSWMEPTINVTTGNILRFEGADYVRQEDFQAGLRTATLQGAKMGEQRTIRRMQQSPGTRRRLGL